MEEGKSDDAVSTQKSLLPSHDPGWNDPPKWAFSSTPHTVTTPSKRILNKRVAFPLSSTQSTSTDAASAISPATLNMPPLPNLAVNLTSAPHSPLVQPSEASSDATSKHQDTAINKEQYLNDALANLQSVINTNIANKSKAEEIQKRLNIMKAVWIEDKLNTSVQQKVLDLSHALKQENVEEADKMHIDLMMHHSSLCASWIPGIRQIILQLKENCKSSTDIPQN